MENSTVIRNIIRLLPKGFEVKDNTNINITDDEYSALISWAVCFNNYYVKKQNNSEEDFNFLIQLPSISKRINIDFGYIYNKEITIEKSENISNKDLFNKIRMEKH